MSTLIETYGPFFGVAMVGLLVCGVLYLLVRSIIWAYRDAEARGKSGWAVALLVLLFDWPISLLLWVVFRPPLSKSIPAKPNAPLHSG